VSSVAVWDGGGANEILTQYRGYEPSLVQTHAYWVTGPYNFEMGFTLGFERATVMLPGLSDKPGLTIFEKDAKDPRFQPVPTGVDGYFVELDYFVNCAVNNKPNDRLPPEAVAQSLKIVEAELRSSKSGQWEKI